MHFSIWHIILAPLVASHHFGTWVFGKSQHEEFSAHEHFGIKLFRFFFFFEKILKNSEKLPKCSCAENSSCRKVPVPKSRNVPMLKRPCARTFPALNDACAEMFPWWNIHAEISLAEISGAEMVEIPIGNNLMYQCIASSIAIAIAFYVCIGCHFVNMYLNFSSTYLCRVVFCC